MTCPNCASGSCPCTRMPMGEVFVGDMGPLKSSSTLTTAIMAELASMPAIVLDGASIKAKAVAEERGRVQDLITDALYEPECTISTARVLSKLQDDVRDGKYPPCGGCGLAGCPEHGRPEGDVA